MSLLLLMSLSLSLLLWSPQWTGLGWQTSLWLRPHVAWHLGVSVRWSLAQYLGADHIYLDVAVAVVIVCGLFSFFLSFFLSFWCMYVYTLSVCTSITSVLVSMPINHKPLSLSETPYSHRKIPPCENWPALYLLKLSLGRRPKFKIPCTAILYNAPWFRARLLLGVGSGGQIKAKTRECKQPRDKLKPKRAEWSLVQLSKLTQYWRNWLLELFGMIKNFSNLQAILESPTAR